MKDYDIIIIGAGLYGTYIANLDFCSNKKILIIEKEDKSFSRASYINQARLHNGYHYPRSLETAVDTHKYFTRFYNDFKYAINNNFTNIYAISKKNSLTTAREFEKFCQKVNIPLKKVDSDLYFKKGTVEAAYKTEEYVFDIALIQRTLINSLKSKKNIEIKYSTKIDSVEKKETVYKLKLNNGEVVNTSIVINTTYASINQINYLFGIEPLNIKYELCEVELGIVNERCKNLSFTIMDGKFFSSMPFGNTQYHTLTSVHFTPHETCTKHLPEFRCQLLTKDCNKYQLANCNNCKYKPQNKSKEMLKLYSEYLKDEYMFEYKKSLYAIKPILLSCENNDARPTIIKKHTESPTYISCLSGKISTIYLMEDYLKNNL